MDIEVGDHPACHKLIAHEVACQRDMDAITAAYDGDIQMIDSTSIRRTTGCDGKKGDLDHCLGRSRGGLTTKMHAVVDGQGLPIGSA